VRTHPPTLLTLARRAIETDGLFDVPGSKARARGCVLAAVSGGPDSIALLHVLALLQKKLGYTLVAHGVDHGLRDEARAELDLAERLAERMGVPFGRTRVTVAAGGNLQARARTARYEALRDAAKQAGAPVIATAHHADDRAETFLLRLLRGSGPTGLAVLPPRARGEDLVRPLLRARRSDIEAHLVRHSLEAASDPSNRDPRFARVQVRTRLLPLLTELSPQIVDHLCALADQLGELPDDPLAGIPRKSREALLDLARGRRPNAIVSLGGDLVARVDRTQVHVVTDKHAPGRSLAEGRGRRKKLTDPM
jgi:tRNA(Ile)-lysidine synthase